MCDTIFSAERCRWRWRTLSFIGSRLMNLTYSSDTIPYYMINLDRKIALRLIRSLLMFSLGEVIDCIEESQQPTHEKI